MKRKRKPPIYENKNWEQIFFTCHKSWSEFYVQKTSYVHRRGPIIYLCIHNLCLMFNMMKMVYIFCQRINIYLGDLMDTWFEAYDRFIAIGFTYFCIHNLIHKIWKILCKMLSGLINVLYRAKFISPHKVETKLCFKMILPIKYSLLSNSLQYKISNFSHQTKFFNVDVFTFACHVPN